MPDAAEDAAPATSPKKSKSAAGKSKKPKTAPSHPKVSDMVNAAISTLKERGGSSLQAIKKYIGAHYKVDVERLAPFIKKYLKTAVANGSLVQTKGKGASGSFRLSASGSKDKSAKKESGKPAAKKAKPAAKKPAKAKKPAPKKPARKPAAAKKSKAAKSPKKPKASKPKSPKPKKAKPAAKKSPKKSGRK